MADPAIPDFEMQDVLGRGGMGVVYRARQLALGREVAVKVFPAGSLDEAQRARFLREMKISIELSHPHLVRFYDAGATDEWLWLAMELVRGASLDRHVFQSGPLPPAPLLGLMASLADALDHVHARGIVHRDIKPANVMMDAAGAPKLMDFGLARKEGDTLLTGADTILGSPRYLAPEAVTDGVMDRRSDLYGLGITFYEAATGVQLFSRGNLQQTLGAIVTDDVPPPSRKVKGFPPALDGVILKLMAKDPAERFASAAELRDALASFEAAPRPRTASRPSLRKVPVASAASDSFVLPRPRARWPLAAAGGAIVALLAVGGALRGREASEPAPPSAVLAAPATVSADALLDGAIARARAALDGPRLDALLREIHAKPPADRLAKRLEPVSAACRDLIARAPAVLDADVSLATKQRVYDALTAPRIVDRALVAARRADLVAGADRALGIAFQVGAVHRRPASDAPAMQAVWEPALFLGIRGSAASKYGGEIESIAPFTDENAGKVSYEAAHELALADVPGARRACVELSLNIPADDDLVYVELGGWKLLLHAGCGDPTRTDPRRKLFSHGVDPRLLSAGRHRVVVTRGTVLPSPAGALVGLGGVTLQLWAIDPQTTRRE